MFVEELEDRIEGLKVECPVDWEPGRVEMEVKLTGKYINY